MSPFIDAFFFLGIALYIIVWLFTPDICAECKSERVTFTYGKEKKCQCP